MFIFIKSSNRVLGSSCYFLRLLTLFFFFFGCRFEVKWALDNDSSQDIILCKISLFTLLSILS